MTAALDPAPSCHGLADLFFDNEESLSTIFECRKVCVTCPLFQSCLEFGVNHFPEVEDGIFAGYPGSARRAMHQGILEVNDWRETWDPESRTLTGLLPMSDEPQPCYRHENLVNTYNGLLCTDCGFKVRLFASRVR